jgi:hypothetical protein
MQRAQLCRGVPAEYDTVYRMGFDAWSEGQAMEIYLERCRAFPMNRPTNFLTQNDHQ